MKKVLVGLSGWVDSAVTAYLLQQQGYEVTAGFMINYMTDTPECTTKIDLEEAKKVAEYLGIKLYTFDFRKEYEERIVQYIVHGYKSGITPNPDVLCNSDIKFRLFLDEAISLWFDAIAMGHYARISHTEDGIYHLLKWVDPEKDQSYFLSRLNQQQLSRSMFPLGNMLKSEVRKIAREAGLPNADRKDSQGICFIGKVEMREFLKQQIEPQEGNIVNMKWEVVWKHQGARGYTIGQRQGLWVAFSEPLFVVKKDVTTNTLTVGTEDEASLYSNELYATQWQWIWKEYPLPLHAAAKIRYRQADQAMNISTDKNGIMKIVFDESQRAVASGQIIALYQGDELLGSWLIQ